MNHSRSLSGVTALAALALVLSPTAAQARGGHDLVDADLVPSMPEDATINGVNPGFAPWILDDGEVRVRSNGRMDVEIEGLQIPEFQGGPDANPIAAIDAVLYCGGAEAAASGPRPLTVPGGDAEFRVWLSVPRHCARASVLIHPVSDGTRVPVYIASARGGH